MQEPAPATDEQWQAILNNDASYNGQFYYAVLIDRHFLLSVLQIKTAEKRKHRHLLFGRTSANPISPLQTVQTDRTAIAG